MRNLRLPLLALPLFAGACAVGPDYAPAALPPQPETGAFVTTAPGTAGTEPQARWWRLYDDPVLDRLVEQALAANTELRAAAANLARAQAVLRESRAGRLPSTDLSGGVNYGDAPGGFGQFGGSGQQWAYSASANVAWEADLFGRVSRTIQAARADAATVAATRDRVAITVAAETARAYTDACAFAAAADVGRESIAIAERALTITSAQEKAGSASRLDFERSATLLANARAALPALEDGHRAALLELAALTGTTPTNVPEDARQCRRPPTPKTVIPIGDGRGLIARRPDVREAERQLAADTARIGIATADLFPRISIGGTGNFFRSDQVKGSNSFSFSLGPLLSWSFPNISVARARIAQAEAGAQASLAMFDGAVLTALKETEQALSAYRAAGERNAALGDAATRADNAYKLADQRFRAGSISFLETLDARRTLIDARAALAASDQQLGSARVSLFKALGGGWDTPSAPDAG